MPVATRTIPSTKKRGATETSNAKKRAKPVVAKTPREQKTTSKLVTPPKSTSTAPRMVSSLKYSYEGEKVAKFFDGTLYHGRITECWQETHDVQLWRVKYQDGDEEDYDLSELSEGLALYRSNVVGLFLSQQEDEEVKQK